MAQLGARNTGRAKYPSDTFNILRILLISFGKSQWEFVDVFLVGGFEYMGFSNVSPNKLIIISSQKETVFDCDNKSLSEIEIDIDDSCISGEGYLNPVCHALPGTIIT